MNMELVVIVLVLILSALCICIWIVVAASEDPFSHGGMYGDHTIGIQEQLKDDERKENTTKLSEGEVKDFMRELKNKQR